MESAQANLAAQHPDLARTDLASAHENAAAAQQTLHGIAGQIWSRVPIAGRAVRDATHLVDAMADTVTVAERASQVQRLVTDSNGRLIANERVNLKALRPILDEASQIAGPLHSASSSLDKVQGDAPFVGNYLARNAVSAEQKLEPLRAAYDRSMPALQALPQILGTDGKKKYLIAVLNPGELRYSGGASLSLAQMTADNGKLSFGEPEDLGALNVRKQLFTWEAVADNPLHRNRPERLSNATFNPNWSISGEELLRAWKVQSGNDCDGLIAIDLPGLSRLFALTGPLQVPPYGELNASNLVSELAGSYDKFGYDEQKRRHELNNAIIPAFRNKFLSGGQYSEKLKALRDAGQARQFVMYFRDPTLQSAMDKMGVAGDLSRTKTDFIFVATQNLNGSKADFFQRRSVAADIKINPDRSISSRVVTTMRNETPPYAGNGVDPRRGYYTRWAGSLGAVFMPDDADVISARINGKVFRRNEMTTRDRRFFFRPLMIRPGGQRNLAFSYNLKNAVSAEKDRWVYRLTVQPQSLAQPQDWKIRVNWPENFTFDAVRNPQWKAVSATSAEFVMSGVPMSTDLELVLEKS